MDPNFSLGRRLEKGSSSISHSHGGSDVDEAKNMLHLGIERVGVGDGIVVERPRYLPDLPRGSLPALVPSSVE